VLADGGCGPLVGGGLSVPIPWETTWEEEVDVCLAGAVPGSDPPVINPCQSHRTEWHDRRPSRSSAAPRL